MKSAVARATALLLVTAAPLGAVVTIERNSTFSTQVDLKQAALCDGSVKLAPGAYKVQVVSLGDGSVRASFFDRAGRKAGEARGIIAVLREAAAPAPGAVSPGAANSVQKIQPVGQVKLDTAGGAASAPDFAKAGFGPSAKSSFHAEGQSLKLEILSADGSRSILIGLLLPAVQKVREAAAQPH